MKTESEKKIYIVDTDEGVRKDTTHGSIGQTEACICRERQCNGGQFFANKRWRCFRDRDE